MADLISKKWKLPVVENQETAKKFVARALSIFRLSVSVIKSMFIDPG